MPYTETMYRFRASMLRQFRGYVKLASIVLPLMLMLTRFGSLEIRTVIATGLIFAMVASLPMTAYFLSQFTGRG